MRKLDLSGSCLCGAVSYEISGDARLFWHCHCTRCRKASGTGHATNIIMTPTRATWTTGDDLLRRYKVPGAKRFGTVFCAVCGSQLPRVAPDLSVAVIPAGTLDHDPGIRPQGRIYQDSRAGWSCDGSELPCHDTYPA